MKLLWTRFPVLRVIVFLALGQLILRGLISGLFWASPRCFAPGMVRFLLMGGLPALAALSAFGIMARWVDRRGLASFGLERAGAVRTFAHGVLLSVAALLGYMGMVTAAGWYRATGLSVNPYLPYILVFFLLVAVGEEVTYRGYVFQTLEGRWGTGMALTVSAAIFGLAHVRSWTSANPIEFAVQPFVQAFLGGLIFGGLFLWRRRLWMPIGAHWAWDFGVALFFDYSQISVRASVAHRQLIYGTGDRVSHVAFWVICILDVAVALLLLRLAERRGQWRARHRIHSPAPMEEINSRG